MKWGLSLRDLFLFLCLCYLTCVGPRFQTLTGEVDISSSFVNLWGFIGLISWLAFHTSDTRFWDSSLKFMAHTMPRINYFSMVFLPMKPSQFRCIRRWHFVIVLLSFLHSGEASNPGPHEEFHWCLGTFNPSGLNGKQQIIAEHLSYGDIWAITETHLSSRSMFAFRKGLKCSENPFSYIVGGHPVPPRPKSAHSGVWNGVACLSKHPTRAVPISWPCDVFESSRIQMTTTLIGDIWVTGMIAYGEPPGQSHPFARENTERLLQVAVENISNMPGLRYIAGDFNFELNTLDAYNLFHHYGFRDLQCIAAERWGIVPQRTCKSTTRKDFCFISQELQELLCQVIVEHDVWADHSVLVGKFQGNSKAVVQHWWRTPQDFSWPEDFSTSDFTVSADFRQDDPTLVYSDMWKQIETAASSHATTASSRPKPSQLGRGQTMQTVKRQGIVAPVLIKPSRNGDIKPLFHGQSRQHAQWFRQLRRIQSYCRFVKAHPMDTLDAHGTSLWRSILVGSGFHPSFTVWWSESCQTKLDGAPVSFPLAPPSHVVAESIYLSFAVEVRSLENSLLQARRKVAQQKRQDLAHLVFQDIKKAPPDRLDLLLGHRQGTICDIVPDDLMVRVESPINLDVSRPCYISGQSRDIVHVESDEVYLLDLTGIEVGQQIAQPHFQGKTEELFDLFSAEWKKRWSRHLDVPPTQWQQILRFSEQHLPSFSFPCQPLEVSQLLKEIKGKKQRSSAGPDGVTLRDLKAMPNSVIQSHCHMFQRAESDGQWPEQTLVGRVASLCKVDCPQSVNDFRPITVISHAYRLWSGIRSKQLLRAIDTVCPTFLFGNRPGCTANGLWAHVQWMIESAYFHSSQLAGVTADIQKAFNFLPREVIMHACLLMGCPAEILNAWSGALAGLQRRFQIRQSLGPAEWSVTGCPEGCAMSCFGMVIIDVLFHNWLQHQFPLRRPMSYVDDWQALTFDPSQIADILSSIRNFTGAVDLLLDDKKTYAWCLDSSSRKSLRSQGIQVRQSAKVLGAQMHFSRKHFAHVIHERIKELQPMWQKLRDSLSPYKTKINAIRMAAWPRGLHGIASTHLGTSCFGPLRSAAMKGLNAVGSGCNPMVHLGLIEAPLTDPQFWATISTLRNLRETASAESIQHLLAAALHDPGLLPGGGPTHALLNRLHVLGWKVQENGKLFDAWGAFHLFDASFPELVFRASHAWIHVVSASVCSRPCFQGLHHVDPEATRAFLRTLNVVDQGLYRKALNGANFTNDSVCYFSAEGSTKCTFCGATDSRHHRFWKCPVFASCRKECPSWILDNIDEFPPCLTASGWRLKSPCYDQWMQTLLAIEGPIIERTQWLDSSLPVDLFTDGSCLWPTFPSYRLASWSVCKAGQTLNLINSEVVQAGPLPGLSQTAFRAEVFAVHVAIRWGVVHGCPIRLWCDCLGVVERLQRILDERKGVKPNVAHADLWNLIFDDLQQLGFAKVLVTKVPAHQTLTQLDSEYDFWVAVHNNLADRAARLANLCRTGEFWAMRKQQVHGTTFVSELGRWVSGVILAVSQAVVAHQVTSDADGLNSLDVVDLPREAFADSDGTWEPFAIVSPLPWTLTRTYGFSIVAEIAGWITQALTEAASLGEQPQWLSTYQLYLDYQLATGKPGPIYDKKWINPDIRPDVRMRNIPFRKRCAWFTKILKKLFVASDGNVMVKVTRPCSVAFASHTACFWIPWNDSRITWIEQWTSQRISRSIAGDGKHADGLPIPQRDLRWPNFVIEERPLSL